MDAIQIASYNTCELKKLNKIEKTHVNSLIKIGAKVTKVLQQFVDFFKCYKELMVMALLTNVVKYNVIILTHRSIFPGYLRLNFKKVES